MCRPAPTTSALAASSTSVGGQASFSTTVSPSRLLILSDGDYLVIQYSDIKPMIALGSHQTPFRVLLRKDVDLLRDARILEVKDVDHVIAVALQDSDQMPRAVSGDFLPRTPRRAARADHHRLPGPRYPGRAIQLTEGLMTGSGAVQAAGDRSQAPPVTVGRDRVTPCACSGSRQTKNLGKTREIRNNFATAPRLLLKLTTTSIICLLSAMSLFIGSAPRLAEDIVCGASSLRHLHHAACYLRGWRCSSGDPSDHWM